MLSGDSPRAAEAIPTNPLPKSPVIAINPDDWQSLARAVQRRAHQFGGDTGYIIEDLATGRVVAHNDNEIFPSASLIKLPILCAAYQAAHEGRFSLSTPITVNRMDKRGGSGILKLAPNGSIYTNRELLEAMIIHSDNTAANLIVQQL